MYDVIGHNIFALTLLEPQMKKMFYDQRKISRVPILCLCGSGTVVSILIVVEYWRQVLGLRF